MGDSDAMRRLRRQIDVAATTDVPVLIVGHDVWQRQQVAELIHAHQTDRQQTSVVTLHCEELDDNLLHWSLQSLAEDGQQPITLILANVHTLTPEAQRVLVEWLDRLPRRWRLIATASPSVDSSYDPMNLDSTLLAYLGTLTIMAIPLADRMTDLPLLAQHFVEQANNSQGQQIAGLTETALDELFLYEWPGGLLQLEEVVTQAHRSAKTPQIQVTDLPPMIHHAHQAAAHPSSAPQPIDLESILAKVESHLIGQAISLAKGNKTQAAQLLGMSRPRFYRRLEQLGLDE